jgi:hypothetical protein
MRYAHELRNEVAEELISDLEGENRGERDSKIGRDARTRGKKQGKEQKRRGMEVCLGKEATKFHSEKQLSEERGPLLALKSKGQAIAKPSEAAKSAGTPHSLTVTCSAVETRALRASRS